VGTRGVVHGHVAEAVNVMLGDLAFPWTTESLAEAIRLSRALLFRSLQNRSRCRPGRVPKTAPGRKNSPSYCYRPIFRSGPFLRTDATMAYSRPGIEASLFGTPGGLAPPTRLSLLN
jgi:hypothetical protein